MNATEDYLEKFRSEYCNQNSFHYVAFKTALKTRRFEIELYWKRATYFWAFIAASFAGFFLLSTKGSTHRIYPFLVACLGFFFTFAFFLVNKGSKFWQENWENHVAVLSKLIVGPLFTTVLQRPCIDEKTIGGVTKPLPISVSKINQWVSVYLLLIWVVLLLVSSPLQDLKFTKSHEIVPYILLISGTGLFSILMLIRSKTDYGPHGPERKNIDTMISK